MQTVRVPNPEPLERRTCENKREKGERGVVINSCRCYHANILEIILKNFKAPNISSFCSLYYVLFMIDFVIWNPKSSYLKWKFFSSFTGQHLGNFDGLTASPVLQFMHHLQRQLMDHQP